MSRFAVKPLFLCSILPLAVAASCDNTTRTKANPAADENAAEPAAAPSAEAAPSQTPSAHQSEFAKLPAPYSEADYSLGRRTFKNCQSCHTIAEGARNLVGPNLYGLFGREVGTVSDFQYSGALQSADFEWTPERLEEGLTNQRDYLPGNRMSFAGVHRPDARHAVIAYLMVESGYGGGGEAAPQDAPTDAED